jgi:hypothetical protein
MEISEIKIIMELEGDNKKFVYRGIPCEINRGPMGALCGYITIPNEYPDPEGIPCHGGVTFCEEGDDETIVGFDCSHYMDLVPKMVEMMPHHMNDGKYRDMAYVEIEIKDMVEYVSKNLKLELPKKMLK